MNVVVDLQGWFTLDSSAPPSITSSLYVAGRIVEYTKRNDSVGTFEDFLEQKAEQYAHAERVESNRLSFVKKEIEWLRRGPKARSTKQKAPFQQFVQT